MMKKTKLIELLSLFILIFISTALVCGISETPLQGHEENNFKIAKGASKQFHIAFSYTPHENITIVNDIDFHAQALGKWDVQGSRRCNSTHPYVIEGLNITDSSDNQIEIQNTTIHFLIRNCFLMGEENIDSLQKGIRLNNVTNAIISTNIISRNFYGISLTQSAINEIINNNIVNNSHYGIQLTSSSDFNVISNNSISDNGWAGIVIASHNNTLSNNDIYSNSGTGVDVFNALYNDITENVIHENAGYGISLSLSGRFNSITKNDFIRNNLGYGAQAFDAGIYSVPNPIASNIFLYNFWDEWTMPDEISPFDIVDQPYPIVGSVFNTDPYPLTTPYSLNLHILLPPIISEFSFEKLSETVTISWTAAIGSFRSHSMEYSIYYSDDTGTNWELLASGVSDTSLQWDTTQMVNGENYWVKVVATCSGGLTAESVHVGPLIINNDVVSTSTATTSPTSTTTATEKGTPGFTVYYFVITIIVYALARRVRK